MHHLWDLPPSPRPQVLDVELWFPRLVPQKQMVIALHAAHGLTGLRLLVLEEDAVVREAEARWAGHLEGMWGSGMCDGVRCRGTVIRDAVRFVLPAGSCSRRKPLYRI